MGRHRAAWLHTPDEELDTRTPQQRAADDERDYAAFFNSDNDDAEYAVEQQRRASAGEDPLPSRRQETPAPRPFQAAQTDPPERTYLSAEARGVRRLSSDERAALQADRSPT